MVPNSKGVADKDLAPSQPKHDVVVAESIVQWGNLKSMV